MDEKDRDNLLRMTKALMEEPGNSEFINSPVGALPGYEDVIKTPMYFALIMSKLRENKYKHTSDWYNDVMLIYENCITFNGEGSEYGLLAAYKMERFERKAVGYNCTDTKEWYKMARTALNDVIKVAGNGPVPQGIDPLLENIVKNAERQVTLKSGEIRHTIALINTWTDNPMRMREIDYLLKKFEPGLEMKEQDSDTIVIDADKLNEFTMKALYMYVKAHSA